MQVCSMCERRFQFMDNYCQSCGLMLSAGELSNLCGKCQKKRTVLDNIIVPFRYEWPVNNMIHQFKFNQRIGLAPTFAQFMMEHWSEREIEAELRGGHLSSGASLKPDSIFIPVPLHKKRYRKRGYNQSTELARQLSRLMSCRFNDKILQRVLYTKPQSELTFKERRRSIRGCFKVKKPHLLQGENIALVDDVMTSGETLFEAARELKRQGAKSVTAWVIARTLL